MDNINKLERKIKNTSGIEKVKVLSQLSQAYLNKSPDKSLEYGKQALELSKQLNNKKEEAQALNSIGSGYYYLGNYDKTLEYYSRSLQIAEQIKYKKGISNCVNNMAIIYNSRGNYDKALEYYQRSLEIDQELGDRKGVASTLLGIGMAYYDLSNYEKALGYSLNSLQIREDINDKQGITLSLQGVGIIYKVLGDYEKALECHQKSLKIREELGDREGFANSLEGIGNIYYIRLDHEKALEYYKKSLKIREEIGDKFGVSFSLNNIGAVYNNSGNHKKALEYYQKSLEIRKEMDYKRGIAYCLNNIGSVYKDSGNYDKALNYFNESIILAKELNLKDIIQDSYEYSSEIYSLKGDYKKALEYYKLYSETKDSIFTEESSKKIAEMQTKYETEKKEKEAEIFRLKNVELVKANNKLKEANKIIAEKNEHIMSSIRYAERIQNAILPLNEKIKKVLPEHFIIFKPRDIVSGDFYWFNQIEDKIIFAVVDCTGHGVPGAFMSMIGNTILNELINEKHILDPALILENLHTEVRFALKQETGEAESTDGMDVCLCVMEPKKHKLTFSGAKRPLYHVANSNLTKIKGDRKTIGGRQKEEKRTFTNHEFDIQEGDAVYLTSDGFADQSDVKGQKFGSKRLENLLLHIATQSCKKQKQKLLTELQNHSGKEEQRDDITVIGIEFNKLEEVKSYE